MNKVIAFLFVLLAVALAEQALGGANFNKEADRVYYCNSASSLTGVVAALLAVIAAFF
jgi:hypothetical protein